MDEGSLAFALALPCFYFLFPLPLWLWLWLLRPQMTTKCVSRLFMAACLAGSLPAPHTASIHCHGNPTIPQKKKKRTRPGKTRHKARGRQGSQGPSLASPSVSYVKEGAMT